MNKIDLGQTASTLANVGIIVGLIFLVLELRQLQDQMDAQIGYNLFNDRNQGLRIVATDEYLPEIAFKIEAGEDVTPMESFRMNTYLRSIVFSWQYEWQQYRRGRYDDFDMRPIVRFLSDDIFGMTAQWKEMRETVLAEDFVAEVEEIAGL